MHLFKLLFILLLTLTQFNSVSAGDRLLIDNKNELGINPEGDSFEATFEDIVNIDNMSRSELIASKIKLLSLQHRISIEMDDIEEQINDFTCGPFSNTQVSIGLSGLSIYLVYGSFTSKSQAKESRAIKRELRYLVRHGGQRSNSYPITKVKLNRMIEYPQQMAQLKIKTSLILAAAIAIPVTKEAFNFSCNDAKNLLRGLMRTGKNITKNILKIDKKI